jgi:hypothetical protein
MQIHLASGKHSRDLRIQVDINITRFPGFAHAFVCEVLGDQRLVLRFNRDDVASVTCWRGIVFAFRDKGAQLPVNLVDPC